MKKLIIVIICILGAFFAVQYFKDSSQIKKGTENNSNNKLYGKWESIKFVPNEKVTIKKEWFTFYKDNTFVVKDVNMQGKVTVFERTKFRIINENVIVPIIEGKAHYERRLLFSFDEDKLILTLNNEALGKGKIYFKKVK